MRKEKQKSINYFFLFGSIFIIGIFVWYLLGQQGQKQKTNINFQNENDTFNKVDQNQLNGFNCLADDCLLINNLNYPVAQLSDEVLSVLNKAINDEYKALSFYKTVIAKFGIVRPFSMIKGAEEQHIASLKTIYDKYGIEVPENNWLGKVAAPETLKEACQIGVEAEIENAALYKDELLPAAKDYEDITLVFTNLMNASQDKHLPAFEKCN